MQFDVKHVIALAVGAIWGITGAAFKIDFSKSCPPAPPAVESIGVPTAK